jgi:hypothetical protein
MSTRRTCRLTSVLLSISALLIASNSSAQVAIQLLDRLQAFDDAAVLDMKVDDPSMRPPDFELLINSPGADFKACKLTVNTGIFCLSGDLVVNWPSGDASGGSSTVVDCNDSVLGLRSCTGLTVDLSGNIWVAGQDRGKTFNVYKIIEVPYAEACPAGFSRLSIPAMSDRCASLWADDRPLVLDLVSVDGDLSAVFPYGKSVVAVQERRTVIAILDNEDRDVAEILGGKSAWGLAGNEKLLSAAPVQVTNSSDDSIENFVVVTTSDGRILAALANGATSAEEVFDIGAERALQMPSPAQCDFDDPHYGVRSSPKSGLIYVTDRQFCQVVGLEASYDGTDLVLDYAGDDLILSTNDDGAEGLGTYAVEGPTLAPGEIVDFGLCGATCTLIQGDGTDPIATVSNVGVVGDVTEGVLFQIEGIPDCRLIPDACIAILDDVDTPAHLIEQGVIIDRQGLGDPSAMLLNVTPLLPAEVTEPFAGLIPDLWIDQKYLAQSEKGYFINALFAVTDATFQGVYEIELDVEGLTGSERGCVGEVLPLNTPAADLIANQDVAVKVSEDYRSVDRDFIPGSDDHIGRLINTDCGSSRGAGGRFSLIAYDLGFNPDTYDPDTDLVTANDDAVFARLLLSLHADLTSMVNNQVCAADDGQAAAPWSDASCQDFNADDSNTLDKLGKCISAAAQGKESLRNQTCQAYDTQFAAQESAMFGFPLSGEDPANRIGEALARLLVIKNIYSRFMFPSIPDDGYVGL